MLMDGVTIEAFLSFLKGSLGASYTKEQTELIERFGDGPTFCFADPGTGKTFSAIGGLLTAELFKQIPGHNIYALSFTRLATGELAVRHQKACETIHIERRVNFKTLHALCLQILSENYRLLDMHKFSHSKGLTFDQSYKLIEETSSEWGVTFTPPQIKSAIHACSQLNNALVFDEDTVKTKMAFKQCKMDYNNFDRIRGLLFSYSLLTETIGVSDILLYTVYLLEEHPEVSTAFKQKCKMMLVDEAQDMSLLQLRIVSLLTDNPVFIGDMKQQIYAFNGACQEVVAEAHKLFPNMVDLQLTQSFRCKNNIADYATKIILPNKIGGESYKGTGDGGDVSVMCGLYEDGLGIVKLAEQLREEFLANRNSFKKTYLFLSRTNVGLIPVVEELYKQNLPFRMNSYKPAYSIPVVEDLCAILSMCEVPNDYKRVDALKFVIPELRGYSLVENPYYRIMQQTGQSLFEINYQFRDKVTSDTAMDTLIAVHALLNKGAEVTELFNTIWPVYYENWLRSNSWKLEAKPEYYINSVNALTHKTYAKFIRDEVSKIEEAQRNERYNRGIRCYTMHASKGLEADTVYIIDANDGLIPNNSQLEKMIKAGCEVDAARAIREERALCYVACTRAKQELFIIYTGESPAPLLLGENPYTDFDAIYEGYKSSGDDIKAFLSFTKRYCNG